MAVILALMNEINPVWTKRIDGIDFVSSFKGDELLGQIIAVRSRKQWVCLTFYKRPDAVKH